MLTKEQMKIRLVIETKDNKKNFKTKTIKQ